MGRYDRNPQDAVYVVSADVFERHDSIHRSEHFMVPAASAFDAAMQTARWAMETQLDRRGRIRIWAGDEYDDPSIDHVYLELVRCPEGDVTP